jgi:hypothetical protein
MWWLVGVAGGGVAGFAVEALLYKKAAPLGMGALLGAAAGGLGGLVADSMTAAAPPSPPPAVAPTTSAPFDPFNPSNFNPLPPPGVPAPTNVIPASTGPSYTLTPGSIPTTLPPGSIPSGV